MQRIEINSDWILVHFVSSKGKQKTNNDRAKDYKARMFQYVLRISITFVCPNDFATASGVRPSLSFILGLAL